MFPAGAGPLCCGARARTAAFRDGSGDVFRDHPWYSKPDRNLQPKSEERTCAVRETDRHGGAQNDCRNDSAAETLRTIDNSRQLRGLRWTISGESLALPMKRSFV